VDVSEEVAKYGDIVLVDVEDSYDNLALKTLAFMKWTETTYGQNGYQYLSTVCKKTYIVKDISCTLTMIHLLE
jgi:hypothetical protein